jgi:hypothetical protein
MRDMMTGSRLAGLLFICLSAWVSGCGSSQSAAAGPAHAGATTAARPVPTNPLELLIGAPSVVVDMRVDRLRSSPLFARARPFVERATCASSADIDWLSASTARAVAAARSVDERIQWLAVLSGTYADRDADRMLAAITQRGASAAPNAVTKQAVGRFAITRQGEIAVSVLDQRLAILGTEVWVRAALDSIDHPSVSFAASSLRRDLAPRVHCADRSVCLLAAADSFASRQLQHALSGLGAKGLGRELSAANTALGLSMPDALEITFLAQLPTPESAAASLDHTKDWFWQAGLLIRLAGLPDVLNAVQAQTSANLLQLDLSVRAADLEQYEQRVGQLVGDSMDGCGAMAAAEPP